MADLAPHLQLRQSLKLRMTPQLQQALKILQLNTMELSSLVEAELADNPMLEEAGSEAAEAPEPGEAASEAEAAPPDEAASAPGPELTPPPEAGPAPERTDELKLDDATPGELADWADYFHDDGTDYSYGTTEAKEEKEGFEAFLTRPVSLQEHLLGQLDPEELDAQARSLVEEVIGRVNERGYFEGSTADLARELGRPASEVFEALRRVQGLDPSGVGARDLRECLLLQLEAKGRRQSLAYLLVADHLPELEKKRFEPLAKALGVGLEELRKAEAEVEALEPIPGRPFGGEPNAGVAVDAVVDKDPLSGHWVVSVNDGGLPRLGINGYYRRLLRHGGGVQDAAEAKAWLKERYQSAIWLMRGIDQRHRTLRRVVEEIVKVQEGFLERGPSAFQPLTLKDIAGRTGLHESTISRVTTSKYVQTPRGVFELKYFFTSALRTEGGGEASSLAVKDRLRDLLEEEQPQAPYSDQELAERLEKEGIHIARRTVAKYREELKVGPAHVRRKL